MGPAPRGGNGYTVGNTGGGDNQTSDASFRIFVDIRGWDHTLGMNNPGQSGDPDSPLYDALFELWAEDRVFPAFFSRKNAGVAFERLELRPEGLGSLRCPVGWSWETRGRSARSRPSTRS